MQTMLTEKDKGTQGSTEKISKCLICPKYKDSCNGDYAVCFFRDSGFVVNPVMDKKSNKQIYKEFYTKKMRGKR